MIPSDHNKYCIECKHSRAISSSVYPLPNSQGIPNVTITHHCTHPRHGLDLVTRQPRTSVCNFERSLAGYCGKDGILFEPKSEIIP